MSVVDRILAFARTNPDKIAVAGRGCAISYRVFAAAILRARRMIDGQAFDRGQVAVLQIHDLLDAWITALALRSLGLTTIAVRALDDIDRLGLTTVIVFATAPPSQPTRHDWIVLPNDLAQGLQDASGGEPTPPIKDGAHILLTSGTTGVYKKVLMDAKAEADLVAINTSLAGIGPETVFNVCDFGLWAGASYTWPTITWSAGGQVVIGQATPLWTSFADSRLTHAVLTPQMLEAILAAPALVALRNDALRVFIVGGVLPRALWQTARERLTPNIICLYGATETCHMTYTPVVGRGDLGWHYAHTPQVLQVVDDQDRPLPAGEIGFVRLLANREGGYLNDEDTTRAFFRGGYFYPGDLGVLDENRRLSLQGRVTDVINIRGDKIGVIPLETALQERLEAKAVCVFSVPRIEGEEVHVAIQLGRTVTRGELKAALAAVLPWEASVKVHSVDSFPRNHMGKIERAKLKAQLLPPEDG